MNPIWRLMLDGDEAFKDLLETHGPPIEMGQGEWRVALLEGGMTSGKPSIAFAMVLPDGRWLFAETSLQMFLTAADAFKAKAGDPRWA